VSTLAPTLPTLTGADPSAVLCALLRRRSGPTFPLSGSVDGAKRISLVVAHGCELEPRAGAHLGARLCACWRSVRDGVVHDCMVGARDKLQVFNSIVRLFLVDVVNKLVRLQYPPKVLSHHKPVLVNVVSGRHRVVWGEHFDVAGSVNPAPASPVRVVGATRQAGAHLLHYVAGLFGALPARPPLALGSGNSSAPIVRNPAHSAPRCICMQLCRSRPIGFQEGARG
jgi:hypothetical protein